MYKIKKFASYYRHVWPLFALDMVCATGIALMNLLFPILTRKFLNDFIPNRQINLITLWSALLPLLYLIRMVFQYIVNYWGHVVGVRMEFRMRRDLFTHLQTLDNSFYDTTRVGYLMSRIVNDLRDVSELAHHGPEELFLATLMLIGSFIYLLQINITLTLLIFALLPLLAWFAITRRTKMQRAFQKEREEIALVNADLENSLSGVREAKSFTNEEYEIKRFDRANGAFRIAREQAFKAMGEYSAGLDYITNLFNILVLCAGGFFVYQGQINYADLTVYLVSINLFVQPIRQLTAFIQQYQQGMTGFERFLELMAVKPHIQDARNAVQLKEVKGLIEIKDITFEYETSEAVLHGISLTIHPGETVALVGSSGGGKTTLARLIPRFYDVTSGEIRIDGVNIKDIQLESLRSNIGVVQQDVFLFSGSIRENILYGNPNASEEEMIAAAKQANIHDFVESLPDKYESYVGEHGLKLSGGQKQRISIARVFLKNPPILILDEATSALDNVTEKQIQAALDKLAQGRTTIVIAHRLSTIRHADRIVVLEEGVIQEMGSHDELLAANGIYAKLYLSQMEPAFEQPKNAQAIRFV
ncbi:MAG TPA: ABC transporter ATP-binding protein [Firmicutes bacterium]|jgi:ATP-binding cassette subfamily B protein|nr:ABC transporter ATP-binding protein [Bacillota bacterium]